ncbi:tRNA synthetases class I-domain-containing protein [Apiosordaria backusii]|uniref:valine--tRNA ligase n=1 Tax=Apiosordaria backusii TaxID=314023 RepID=A0AA39ZSN7_9PEZI|nr:tRNA synthetases class I-domain-containing protein [Apiosordaria backusii]
MDKNLSTATLETFCRLYNEGYIYRSNRLVNWCTKLNTAISGLEVENKEITGRTLISVPGYDKKVEFGVLTFFKYPIDGTDETIEWWVRMKELAEAGLEVVENGEIKIMPESANKSYKRWLTNINDWCISRQLWWGHRIPAYLVVFDGEDSPEADASEWIVAKSEEEARATAEAKFGPRKFHLEQDPDCLDTGFSAGLWPMATLGWPNTESPDFKNFFPTSLLETGWDILFFWVACMIMFSVKLTGSVPFKEVYCHSLIRGSEGRKISKSLGNVIDPLDIISGIELESLHAKLLVGNLQEDEVARATKHQKIAFPSGIPKCGADTLRFALVSYTTGGGDINFDIKVMHAYRRFCNKIWQASKYVLGKLPENFVPVTQLDTFNGALEAREFSRSTKVIYQFFYDELCDVFIENSKSIVSDGTPEQQNSIQQTLFRALDTSLRLMHPFMPFITEELWQRLPRPRREGDTKSTIMLAPYPEYDAGLDFHADALDYELGLSCARGIRSLAADYGIRAERRAHIKAATADSHANASAQLPTIKALCGKGIDQVHLIGQEVAKDALPKGCAVFVISSDIAVLLEVGSRITDAAAEKTRQLLLREGFDESASDVVISAEKKKLVDAQAAAENYQRTIEEFEKLKIA